jgi:hypothetical protein
MTISDELLNQIDATFGAGIQPNLTTASAVSDIFEVYVFSLVVRAAETEGATVAFYDVYGQPANTFIFRTSPGHLWSSTQPYTYARLSFPTKELLEAHLGVRVAGRSHVLHELDVCVLTHAEAETCRRNQVPPRSSRVLIAVECKFYTSLLSLDLARAFIGLESDISTKDAFFVTNTSSSSVERLLTARSRKWEHNIVPSSQVNVDRLRNTFQLAFKNFKAR